MTHDSSPSISDASSDSDTAQAAPGWTAERDDSFGVRWKKLRGRSIRRQVMAIALVPCAIPCTAGAVSSAGLYTEARTTADWSDYLTDQIGPVIGFTRAVQAERTASFEVVQGTPAVAVDLQRRRAATDAGIDAIRSLGTRMDDINPHAVAKSNPVFYAAARQLPILRQSVDMGRVLAARG